MKYTIILLLFSRALFGQIAQDSGYWEYHYMNSGLNNLNSQKYKRALKDYNNALKFGCKSYDKIGLCKMGLKDYKGAIQDFTKAIEYTPTDGYSYNYRALVKHKIGDKKGACEDWQKAFELGLTEVKDKISKFCK